MVPGLQTPRLAESNACKVGGGAPAGDGKAERGHREREASKAPEPNGQAVRGGDSLDLASASSRWQDSRAPEAHSFPSSPFPPSRRRLLQAHSARRGIMQRRLERE